MASKWQRKTALWLVACVVIGALTTCFAGNVQAQNQSGGQPAPAPTPASGSSPASSATDPLVSLVLVAGNLIPKLQEAIESPLVAGLENLAFWIAVVVMMISFARLFRENDGASRDLFWWCFRLAIIFALFGTGRTIINTASQIGYDIINVTEFRKVFWDAELEFNTNYEKFTEGMFIVKSVKNPDEAIGALTSESADFRDITKMLDASSWNLSNVFIGVTIGRFLLEFAQIFLAILSAMLAIGLRLFAPFAIALAIDRNLAQRISYPFAWSAAVFTLITPLVSHILGLAVYTAGNLAFKIISPEMGIFTLDANGVITGDPARVNQAVYACVILTVMMILSALLLLASPYISYKLSFGQVFEAISTTASGWLGAFAATALEISGLKYGTALQRQAGEARIEGQYQAELARASAIKDSSNLASRAQQILGLHSASANRSQALGAIAGGYAMSTQMTEAHRQATLGLLEQGRRQQVTGFLADRSLGQQQTNIAMRREEYDLRISQADRNVNTLVGRSIETVEHGVGAVSTLGGGLIPALGALNEGGKIITTPAKGLTEIGIHNITSDARVENLRRARGEHIENYEFTGQLRIDAAEHYAKEASKIADTQATANIAAARAQRDLAISGVEQGYHQQTQGVNSAYRLNLEANQLNFAGAMKAAELIQASGMKAVKLEQMSQIVTTLSRDMARRAELALTMRY
ncbi:MAG: hypothetical protein HONDAALG_02099 [Gammaproteobacteria bacterium]|nr:hypothetical protein [Gammaproteobacteria bacterium]